jgi:hypothetical protein
MEQELVLMTREQFLDKDHFPWTAREPGTTNQFPGQGTSFLDQESVSWTRNQFPQTLNDQQTGGVRLTFQAADPGRCLVAHLEHNGGVTDGGTARYLHTLLPLTFERWQKKGKRRERGGQSCKKGGGVC